jgi:hypothetical protein
VQLAKWQSVRQQGRRRYIFLHGVLGWGVPTALLSTVIGSLLGAPGPVLGRLAIALVAFSLTGIWFGARMWSDGERRYLERNQQGESPR